MQLAGTPNLKHSTAGTYRQNIYPFGTERKWETEQRRPFLASSRDASNPTSSSRPRPRCPALMKLPATRLTIVDMLGISVDVLGITTMKENSDARLSRL